MRAGRALAVGAPHRDDDGLESERKSGSDRPHPFETQFNRLGVQRLDPLEPLRKLPIAQSVQETASLGCLSIRASRRAISSRMTRRSTIMSIAPLASKNSAR